MVLATISFLFVLSVTSHGGDDISEGVRLSLSSSHNSQKYSLVSLAKQFNYSQCLIRLMQETEEKKGRRTRRGGAKRRRAI